MAVQIGLQSAGRCLSKNSESSLGPSTAPKYNDAANWAGGYLRMSPIPLSNVKITRPSTEPSREVLRHQRRLNLNRHGIRVMSCRSNGPHNIDRRFSSIL